MTFPRAPIPIRFEFEGEIWMKKILFIGGTSGGGVATINTEVIRIFHDAGYEYRLVDTEKMKARMPVLLAYLFCYVLTFAKLISFRPQAVYLQIAQTGYFHQSVFLLIGKLLGRETVAHFHANSNLKEMVSPWHFKKIMLSEKYIDKMILLTKPCRHCLVDNGWKKPTYVVPNFISTEFLPQDFKPVSERKKFLFLGRMDWKKGIFEILEIARRLPDEDFVFVGNFEEKAVEERFCTELAEIKNADWLGPVYDEGKYEIIARSKILLFPTRRDEFPMTLIEATILGCVPLVSLVGSVGEIIKDGFNGFYIDPDNVDGIIRKLGELEDVEILQRVSDNGIKYARAHFTNEVVRAQLLNIVG